MTPVGPGEQEREALRAEAFEWMMRRESAPSDPALQAAIDAWLAEHESHRAAWRGVERMWQLAGELPAGYADQVVPDEDEDAASALPGIAGKTRRAVWSARRSIAGLAMAALAACLAVVLLPALLLRFEADVVTGSGELRSLVLDDGSRVTLDAESAMAVEIDTQRRRLTLLAGQVWIEVAHGDARPFSFHAGGIATTATGTAFAGRLGPDTVAVSLSQGGVDVAATMTVRLKPGEQAVVNRESGAVRVARVPPADIAAWRERRLVVDGAPLSEVLAELDRHHTGLIVLGDDRLADRRITGIFDLSQPVAALEALVRTQHGSVLALTPYVLLVTGP